MPEALYVHDALSDWSDLLSKDAKIESFYLFFSFYLEM